MKLLDKLKQTFKISSWNGVEVKVVGIIVKDKELLKNYSDIAVFNMFKEYTAEDITGKYSSRIIGVFISGQLINVPIILDQTFEDDFGLQVKIINGDN